MTREKNGRNRMEGKETSGATKSQLTEIDIGK